MNFLANLFQNKKFLLLASIVLIGLLIFRVWLNKGFVSFEGIKAPFEADFVGHARLQCEKENCEFSLPPDKYIVRINKEGFFQTSAEVNATLGQHKVVLVKPKKIPSLDQLEQVPAVFKENLTPISSFSVEDFYAVDEVGNVFVLSREDNKFYFLGVNGKREFVSQFEGIEKADIYPAGNKAFVVADNQLFEVDIKRKRKYQLLAGKQIKEVYFDKNFLFVQAEGGILFRKNDEDFQEFNFDTDLNSICVVDNKKSFFIVENNAFYQISVDDLVDKTQIIDFSINKPLLQINCESEDSILLLLEGDQAYRLSF